MIEQKSLAELKEHYEIEKELASKLRDASKEQRRALYTSLYDELYRRVPHHPQLLRKKSASQQLEDIKRQLKLLEGLLDKNTSLLEIGPGDCSFAFQAASKVGRVYAVDVSNVITEHSDVPDNFKLFISDGCIIPLEENTIDVAYSNQLMEHLHPDDAYEQLKNIFKVLTPGGVYLCITPNRLNGPHDVSKYFDSVATGLHLKEYTITELSSLFRKVGFSRVKMLAGGKGVYFRFPVSFAILLENMLQLLPVRLRRKIADTFLVKAVISIRLIGIK
jgi:SAM-dependent methyltransferase